MNQKIKKNSTKISGKLSAWDYALYLLSMRLRSSGDLAQKMHQKGYSDQEILKVIQRLTDLQFLNDEQFAQIFFDNLVKYKLFGYFGIKKKLLERKIDPKLVERLLRQFSVAEELKIAQRAGQRNSKKSQQQLIRFLQSKGFRSEVIFKVARVRSADIE